VPPLAAEVLAYEGLHRAAWHGDLPKLKSLIASGANLDARDRAAARRCTSPPTRGSAMP
jgi:hypothetical protein